MRVQTRAVESVPRDAAVSASYNIVTHMTHRQKIYEFPVPWCNINWGVRGRAPRRSGKVQYLVLNRGLVTRRDIALLDDLLSHEFAVVSDDQGILVAKRVNPPERPLGPNPADGECFARPSLAGF